MNAPWYEHTHAEAFRLMTYRCRCGHAERIWNSRDGVTPFGTSCPSCGGHLTHSEWDRDEYAPGHRLHAFQRFFRDGTEEEARNILAYRSKMVAGQGFRTSRGRSIERVVAEAAEGEFPDGWPITDVYIPERVNHQNPEGQ